ncbi:MAG: fructosamine kinase family protein [Prolixibacteraceae bacterium]|nr:fructosamine kinase family protein [Prolixibacteraceae bacterium]
MEKILEIVKRQLSEKLGTEIEIKSNSILGGGCINHASKIETTVGSFFLKWNNHCAADVFLREAESLKELAKENNPYLKIPEVILSKELDSEPGFILLEYLESSNRNSDGLNLGRGLATIHRITNEKYGFYSDNYCGDTIQNNKWNGDWINFFGEQRLRYLINLIRHRRGLDSCSLNIYEKLIDKLPELIPSDSVPSLIHGDLWSGNYVHTTEGPALIDPASYYANREMEMGIMTMFGGFSQQFWDGYNEIFPLPGNWRERNKLYQLYHILNHYYIFGGGYGHQALSVAQRYI